MTGILGWLLNPPGLTPHGFCLVWQPGLIWLHVASDAAIGLAYFSIPLVLATIVRRRPDLAIGWVFWLFVAFIALCGTTHFVSNLTLWVPAYGLEGVVMALTAVVSLATAVALWPLLPRILALPSPADLRAVNAELSREAVDRERAMVLLRESEDRHRALWNRTPAALHTLDPLGRVLAVNDAWLALLGYAREDVVGRPVADFQAAGAERGLGAEWATALAEGGYQSQERRFARRSGEEVHVLVSATTEPSPDGAVARVHACLTDLTARERAESALRASEEQLRRSQKMEAIGRLTGGVAHDFNNMLQVIGGGLESIRRKLPEGRADLHRLAAMCLEAAARSGRLTSQLLSFSRRQSLAPDALDLAEVVEGVRAMLLRTVGQHATLDVAESANGWCCLADRSQLESATLNLVINARDAMAVGGRVSVRWDRFDVGPAGLPGTEDALPPGAYASLTVTDDGRGMDAETRRRAVEPFFTTKPPGEGTGLGLSQIYGFAKQSGGTIAIDTAPGRGTAVSVILPLAPAAPPRRQAAPDGETPPTRTRTVLLVDDEAAILEITREALEEFGYRVLPAGSPEAAREALAGPDHLDLLVTDVVMPGSTDGIALAAEARRMRPDLPVVFSSGHAGGDDRWRSVVGARFLHKPYGRAELAEAAARVIADGPVTDRATPEAACVGEPGGRLTRTAPERDRPRVVP